MGKFYDQRSQNTAQGVTHDVVLPEDLDPRLEDTSRRVVPMLTFLRELDGALDEEELAEEGLFPSTESSSSKFLSKTEAQKPQFKNYVFTGWRWWRMSLTPALERHRQVEL